MAGDGNAIPWASFSSFCSLVMSAPGAQGFFMAISSSRHWRLYRAVLQELLGAGLSCLDLAIMPKIECGKFQADSWWIEIVLRLVFCYQSAVAMRIGSRLASAKFTLLPRSGSASRTASSEYLFRAEFFCHRKPPCTKGGQLDQFGTHLDGLRFRDNRHGPILQKGADKCAIYLQATVVLDEALLLKRIHKFTYPCAGSTNHLREGCLAHLQGVLRF